MSETSTRKGPREAVISVRNLSKGFEQQIVFDKLNLDVYRGEVLGIVGGSGTGKSVLMRCITGLMPVRRGTIEIFGKDVSKLGRTERVEMDTRLGVLFQDGALFGALTCPAKYPGSHARTSRYAQRDDGRAGSDQAENGGPASECRL